jgi:hypothetical protein
MFRLLCSHLQVSNNEFKKTKRHEYIVYSTVKTDKIIPEQKLMGSHFMRYVTKKIKMWCRLLLFCGATTLVESWPSRQYPFI